MARIYNNEIGKKLSSELRVKQSELPQEASEKVVLNYSVNDPIFYCHPEPLVRTVQTVDDISTQMFTTDANKTTYITGIALAVTKGVTNTSQNTDITSTILGASRVLFGLNYQPGTAGSHFGSIVFPYPIRVGKNVNVTLAHDEATDINATASVYGFVLVDAAESRT